MFSRSYYLPQLCTIGVDTNMKLPQNKIGSHEPCFLHKFYSRQREKGRITIASVRKVRGDVVGNNKHHFKKLKEENYLHRSNAAPAVMFLPSISRQINFL